ncbi:hypothetical protein TNCV_815961 [Trichonephila clavipes]|nr:hypothetical protein TNCV_815961 [Trichonephila clavipes]
MVNLRSLIIKCEIQVLEKENNDWVIARLEINNRRRILQEWTLDKIYDVRADQWTGLCPERTNGGWDEDRECRVPSNQKLSEMLLGIWKINDRTPVSSAFGINSMEQGDQRLGRSAIYDRDLNYIQRKIDTCEFRNNKGSSSKVVRDLLEIFPYSVEPGYYDPVADL